MKLKSVIILLGPTAVGKTGVSILLAKALNTEIISADSMQIYRHMDIGTAKPSPDLLKEVPHHLINILSPHRSFSAGMFREKATKIINDLHAKDKIPLIAGGTGLYIRTLTQGLFEGPSADWAIREKLKEEEEQLGKGHLYSRLRSTDPSAAEKIRPNDIRRIIRALEVSQKAKEGISEIQKKSTQPLHCVFIKVGLSRDRKELYRIIEERVDKMMADGLLEETKKLMKMHPDRTALQALGYKEIGMSLLGNIELGEAVTLLKKRTKMYAKRQITWFKKEPDIKWVDVTGISSDEEIYAKVLDEVDPLRKIILENDTAYI